MLKPIISITLIIGFCLFAEGIAQAPFAMEGSWFLRSIHTPENLTPKARKEKIVIAIVDDGVRITHRDLSDFIWKNPKEIPNNHIDDDGNGHVDDIHGWDVSDDNNTVTPPQNRLEDYYHGTHLAGIVTQIAELAFGAAASDLIQIMPVKSIADRAERLYLKDGFKGIKYAIKAGADIIICSWGINHISPEESKILQEADEEGVLIVASAGNFPEEREQFPAAHKPVLAAAALNPKSLKIENSNYGQFVDLSAPGIDIRSTSALTDTDYESREGTSFAVPMVAAAAALVKLEHPSYSAKQVEACLKSSAEAIDITNPEYSGKLGAGKLNIEAAITCTLFQEETREETQLRNPKGYLRFHALPAKSATWLIRPHGHFKGIWLRPLSVRKNVDKGIFKFYSDQSSDARLIGTYPLDALPESIYIPGVTAFVTFEPENTHHNVDWLMEYEIETIDFSKLYCSGIKNLDVEGRFEDGSGPNDYSAKSDCKWLITAPKGKVIHIKFIEFDTEAKTDLVYFFNGSGTHEKIMAIFSGPNIPPELTTWRNQALVWFVTDGKNQGKGWKAEYRFQDP
jgi:hypothetical protein